MTKNQENIEYSYDDFFEKNDIADEQDENELLSEDIDLTNNEIREMSLEEERDFWKYLCEHGIALYSDENDKVSVAKISTFIDERSELNNYSATLTFATYEEAINFVVEYISWEWEPADVILPLHFDVQITYHIYGGLREDIVGSVAIDAICNDATQIIPQDNMDAAMMKAEEIANAWLKTNYLDLDVSDIKKAVRLIPVVK